MGDWGERKACNEGICRADPYRHPRTLVELFGEEAGNEIPVLYGGSVNPENAVGLSKMEHIDGLFIGRSAWQADNFNKIIRDVLK